jgi:hypothetical protein
MSPHKVWDEWGFKWMISLSFPIMEGGEGGGFRVWNQSAMIAISQRCKIFLPQPLDIRVINPYMYEDQMMPMGQRSGYMQ